MEKSICLKVVECKTNIYYYLFAFLTKTLILYWAIVLIISLFNPQASYRCLYVFGVLYLFMMILLSIIFPTFKVIGNVILTEKYIDVCYLRERFYLNTLKDFRVNIDGYRFQPHIYGRIVSFSNGVNNSITFHTEERRLEFRFLIKSRKSCLKIHDFFFNEENCILNSPYL